MPLDRQPTSGPLFLYRPVKLNNCRIDDVDVTVVVYESGIVIFGEKTVNR